MSSAYTDAPPTSPSSDPIQPSIPTAGNCPAGGSHAPIPVQGKDYSICAKCGETC